MTRRPGPQMRGFDYVYCETHRKIAYVSKKEAKRARRALHPGDHKDIYPCTRDSSTFHLGEMPYHVLNRGFASRSDINTRPDASQPTPLVMPRRRPLEHAS